MPSTLQMLSTLCNPSNSEHYIDDALALVASIDLHDIELATVQL